MDEGLKAALIKSPSPPPVSWDPSLFNLWRPVSDIDHFRDLSPAVLAPCPGATLRRPPPLPLRFTGRIHPFLFNSRVIVEEGRDNAQAIWAGLKAIISPN